MSSGSDLCKSFESYAIELLDGSCKAYWDAMGAVWTIGWGSTGKEINKGTIWSREKADLEFDKHWDKTKAGVLRASPGLIGNRLEAVVCLAYNIGVGAYQSSTLRRKVNLQEWDEAAAQFLRWNRSGGRVLAGLSRRRKEEMELFLSSRKD